MHHKNDILKHKNDIWNKKTIFGIVYASRIPPRHLEAWRLGGLEAWRIRYLVVWILVRTGLVSLKVLGKRRGTEATRR